MMEFIDLIFAAEHDTVRQQYILKKLGRRRHLRAPNCLLGDVFDAVKGTGHCARHGKTCEISQTSRLDCVTLGPPCEPHSSKRTSTAASAESHKDFATLFEDAWEFVVVHRPRGGIIEEVGGFDRKRGEFESCADELVRRLESIGYQVQKIKLNAVEFCQFPRLRTGSDNCCCSATCSNLGY
jgi:site-specific DNA-cytosine methylase